MPEQFNPFKRLYNNVSPVIESAREYGFSTDTPAQEVWILTLSLDELGFLQKLHELMLIVDSCEQIVRMEQDINQEMYLARIQKVKQGLSLLSFNSGLWGAFRSIFNDDFMDALVLMSENISIRGGEEVISEENLTNLQAEVEDVIDRVVDSELDTEFKQVLLDGLESVRQAILNYRITGAEGIRNAIDRNVGSYARYRDDFERVSETENQNIIHAYKNVINEVNGVISTALKFKQLAEPAVQVLPMLGMG